MSKNISRRDFLKVSALGMGATFLAACGRALGITVTPSPTLTRQYRILSMVYFE
jgi:hypothetical protein